MVAIAHGSTLIFVSFDNRSNGSHSAGRSYPFPDSPQSALARSVLRRVDGDVPPVSSLWSAVGPHVTCFVPAEALSPPFDVLAFAFAFAFFFCCLSPCRLTVDVLFVVFA